MAGIYFHIPFCRQACHYCDFHFSTSMKLKDRMLAAMKKELELQSAHWGDDVFTTIYFGGGTPSVLEPEDIASLLNHARDLFVVDAQEVSLEVNPDDFQDLARARDYRSIGVNRLSMGVQSFDDKELRWMNRAHSASEARLAIEIATKAGFQEMSIDLIYGIPDSSVSSWRRNLDIFLDYKIPHLSAYALTVEDKTPLDRLIKKGSMKSPDELDFYDQFYLLREVMLEATYEHYEISNFCLPGRRSLHNSSYWSRKPYLGIGPSAHSFKEPVRYWNVRSNTRYIEALEQGKPFSEQEELTVRDRWNEMMLTGLRTSNGLDLEILPKALFEQAEQTLKDQIMAFERKAWLVNERGILKLSAEGMAYADHIASELFM